MRVERTTYAEAKEWITTQHYSRKMPCVQYAFALKDGDKTIGIVTYGQPASPWLCKGLAGEENRKRVIELNRLVVLDDAPKNAASTLIGRSLRALPKGMFVVSYADAGAWAHVGYVYQATNFLYTGLTKRRTDIYSESGHSRHHCGDRTKRQTRSEKHRYVFVTGGSARLKAQIRYPVLPYPKGETRRYDTSNPKPVGKE